MERQQLVNLGKRVLRPAAEIGRTVLGGAWGELGDTYGEATGGHEPHPLTIPNQPDVIPITGVGIPERSTRARAA